MHFFSYTHALLEYINRLLGTNHKLHSKQNVLPSRTNCVLVRGGLSCRTFSLLSSCLRLSWDLNVPKAAKQNVLILNMAYTMHTNILHTLLN